MASHKLLLLETSLKSIISYVMGTHRLGGYTNLTDNRLRQKMIPFPNGYFIIPAIFISLNIFCMIACRQLSSSCVFSLWWLFVYVILHRSSFISTYRRTKLLTCLLPSSSSSWSVTSCGCAWLFCVRYPLMILSKEKKERNRREEATWSPHQPPTKKQRRLP